MNTPHATLIDAANELVAAHTGGDFLAALRSLHRLRGELDTLEPALIDAARQTGASWQDLAQALGVASRQAAERRYLRLVPARTDQTGSTREKRVREVRDQRAGNRAVNDWANQNTADLRRLAAQVTALHLDPAAATDLAHLNQALGDPDATALPGLLATARRHLDAHPALAAQVDVVTAHTRRVRAETQQHRDGNLRP